MAKNAQARMDKAELTPLRAWAEKIVKADDVLARTIGLENGIEALEGRRATLSGEVAELLATTEATRQTLATLTADRDVLTAGIEADKRRWAQDETADKRRRDQAAATAISTLEAAHAARAAELKAQRDTLAAEVSALEKRKAALAKDLADTIAKHQQP